MHRHPTTPDSDEVLLLAPNEGAVIIDEPGRRVTVKVEHELISAAECWLGAGSAGDAPHVHHRHANAFYVLEGELAFELGSDRSHASASAGTLVTIPPGVVHGYVNAGAADARFLEVYGPGVSFQHQRDGGWDNRDTDMLPPSEARRAGPQREAVVHEPGSGDSFTVGAATLVVKADTRDSDAKFTLMELTLATDLPPPTPHRHPAMTDGFYVLEGPAALDLGDRSLAAAAGSFAFVPPGALHAVANRGGEPVRALTLMAPAGFETVLKGVAAHLGADASDPAVVGAHIASRLGGNYLLDQEG